MKWFRSMIFDGREYRVFKPIMWCVALGILTLLIMNFSLDSFSGKTHGYSLCDREHSNLLDINHGCFNSFYNSSVCGKDTYKFFHMIKIKGIPADDPLCTVEYMYGGQELGSKPPFIFTYFWYIVAFLAVVGLVVNHIIFNVDYSKKEREVIGGQL